MTTSNALNSFLHTLSYVILMNALIYSYLEYQVPFWGYLGYESDYSVPRLIVANIAVISLSFIVPKDMDSLSNFVLVFTASSIVVSILALYAARGFDITYLISVLVFILVIRAISSRLRFRIPSRNVPAWPIVTISILFIGMSVAWIIFRGGLGRINFQIADIYSVRSVAMDTYFVGAFAYILNWAQKGFGTALFALGIMRKSYGLIAFSLLIQIFFYATLGQKMPIAMLVFVFIAIYIAKNQTSAVFFNTILIFVLFVAAILVQLLGNEGLLLNSLFVKRIYFAPAESAIVHFQFFSENAHTYFSDSLLRGVIEYPYSNSIMELISFEMIGKTGINPNIGIIATGYQHLGYLGLLMYAVIAGIILSFCESLSKNLPLWVPLSVAGLPMYIMFSSTDMSRAMITHGGLIAMAILFFWPNSSATAIVKNKGRI